MQSATNMGFAGYSGIVEVGNVKAPGAPYLVLETDEPYILIMSNCTRWC